MPSLHTLEQPALSLAVEANFAQEMICFGRYLPNSEVCEDQNMLWFYTGMPNLNGVLFTHFTSDDQVYIRTHINTTLDYFKARKVAVDWAIGPSTTPINLVDYLNELGFAYTVDIIGMALDMQVMHENLTTNSHLVIREAIDSAALQPILITEMEGFGASEELAQTYYEMYVNAGFGPGKSWHHYIGYLDDQPVASASLLLHAGVAGIYGVATIQEAQRQGIGTTMMLHTLHAAQALGYHIASLSPTKMSQEIYRRIGFQECCRISHYGWSPE